MALISGAVPSALKIAGFSPADRKDKQPWVKIRNMPEAVRLVPVILAGHDTGNGQWVSLDLTPDVGTGAMSGPREWTG
jgi:hypothetical protein